MTRATAEPTLEARASAPESTPVPPGHVERTLNFRDRLLIFMACNTLVTKAGPKGNHPEMSKLAKIRKVLGAEEVDEYYDTLNEKFETKVSEWAKAQNLYRSFNAMKGGVMTQEQFKRMFPEASLQEEPLKPVYKEPAATMDDKRGEARVFHIKANLEAMIESALKAMHWDHPADAEFVAELAEKYGLDREGS